MTLSIPVSFEFFPPKTAEGEEKLMHTVTQLATHNPEFFSVTYGAGGSTQAGTFNAVANIRSKGFEAAPHLSCVGATRANTLNILDELKAQGVNRIVALRGDLPSGMGGMGELAHASDLVSLIREHSGDWFHISVAAYPEYHPQAKSAQADIDFFVQKCRAGADSAITQYFYNIDAYFAFVDAVRAKGIDIPIVPGIMPIASFSNLCRFSDMCGAEVPRWLRLKLQAYGDDTASIKALGLDVVTDLCDRLLSQGAPSLHFYTLNQAGLVSTVCQRLGY